MHQFHLGQQRVCAHYVGIALVELAIASLLRTVGSPYGLYLITAEGHGQFLAVLHHVAREGHSQVVAEALLAEACSQVAGCALGQFPLADAAQEVAAVQYLEEQFVALLAVLAHQRAEVLHCGRLYLLETIEFINLANGVEDIVSSCCFLRTEVACPLGNTGFLCHLYYLLSLFWPRRYKEVGDKQNKSGFYFAY